ncbi:primosomal protein N' [Microvirga tunisiensis]|uniref:Replication restart protein PriA n=1 Tax=Pannonibacter tanglangensis TaxID=2750084 RepID=A0A7X5JA01_9HYPH|nr:primosomal protein N' [Pannonibacter sp. XCT-53]
MLFDDLPEARETIASVLVPVAVPEPYTYRVPAGAHVVPGSIVRVPLGTREVTGAVWDTQPDAAINPRKLKEILHVHDAPPLNDELRRFIDWVAGWTLAAPGMVLRMVLRSEDALEPEPPVPGLQRVLDRSPDRMTPARARVLATAADGLAWTRSGLAATAGVSTSVIDGLAEQGVFEPVFMTATPLPLPPDPAFNPPQLTPTQAGVAEALVANFDRGGVVALIDGVTGSGKTEVYFEAVAEALRRGRQAVILVPEIGLTEQFLRRFETRFGVPPAEWHSEITPKKRARVWRGVASGEVQVVVGARSALFLPFSRLGLIVVDEEHDTAFKQDDRVSYNARDMAVVRGHLARIPVVLASATPSVESRVNADLGRYQRHVLPERASGASLPDLAVIDMRTEGPERGRWIAPGLVSAIRETFAQKGQSLLFLNRRGYAPLTLCRSCGHRFQCSQCSAWLVEHRMKGKLVCHHCGHTEAIPRACPACGTQDALVACGPGVERVAEEVEGLFPDARVLVLSSDLLGGPDRLRREMKLVEEGGADIVIGTQLVAKGHNFPLMKLVGVIDADLGLAHGDPRAAERTFQLLAQVTGRAGRITGGGRGLLQSYSPDHPVLKALLSSDREAFYRAEIEARRAAGLPPFGRLAALVISGPEKAATEAYARAVSRVAPADRAVTILGPAEAALAMVRGRHRYRLLAMAPRQVDLQGYLRHWMTLAPPARGGLKLQIDIDPQQFL